MVPARPFLIGRPGCVRSSAWIWLFSSTASTTALPGGARLLAGGRGAAFDEPAHAGLDEIVLPAPDRRFVDADCAHDLHDPRALGRHQHDPHPLGDLLLRVTIPGDP